jgi:endonuclease YncB( thermonuclease family)
MVFDHDFKKFPELTNQQLNDFGFSSPHVQYTEDFDAVVVKVSDGDTIRVTSMERDFDFPVRFLDIDAPELSEGGEVTREWLKSVLLGEKVSVRIDRSNRVGKYGRLLGRVVFNGLDVGEQMLHLGLVSVFGSKNEGVVPDSGLFFRLNQWF